ncbi:hypothetical protein E3U43_012916 [Larimichthys crocea]|uniref:Uncharacterized protein n=1 Tax=Larimichthys crocea TaxID=215358 RepID=A0ACD3RUL7_LARCR|nr:hypothetical protein E3U43_012916 [Larimichthys crocea]
MASGKKSALLSSLADYGDDSEPDSEPEGEETVEGRAGGLVYRYDEDDLNRTEDADDKRSGDEDSRESNSEMDESDEGRDADDVEVFEPPLGVGWIGFGEGSSPINSSFVL